MHVPGKAASSLGSKQPGQQPARCCMYEEEGTEKYRMKAETERGKQGVGQTGDLGTEKGIEQGAQMEGSHTLRNGDAQRKGNIGGEGQREGNRVRPERGDREGYRDRGLGDKERMDRMGQMEKSGRGKDSETNGKQEGTERSGTEQERERGTEGGTRGMKDRVTWRGRQLRQWSETGEGTERVKE